MKYIDTLRSAAISALELLHDGVGELRFTDFPDYENIGDSAIALGQWAYWDERDIIVRSVTTAHTLDPIFYQSDIPVLINGGGNMGGLYKAMSEHRYRLAERLKRSTLLIQAPQSVHFPDAAAEDAFYQRFATRANLRVGVRDAMSVKLLRKADIDPVLAPDSVHVLGQIGAPAAVRDVLVLARQDRESSGGYAGASSDWPQDPLRRKFHTAVGWRTKQVPALRHLVSHPPQVWRAWAEQRLRRGVQLLSGAEVVITDRLHAMLISLQMGRRVIAVDNNNRKLRNYAETWLDLPGIPLEFAGSLDEAHKILSHRQL